MVALQYLRFSRDRDRVRNTSITRSLFFPSSRSRLFQIVHCPMGSCRHRSPIQGSPADRGRPLLAHNQSHDHFHHNEVLVWHHHGRVFLHDGGRGEVAISNRALTSLGLQTLKLPLACANLDLEPDGEQGASLVVKRAASRILNGP